MYEYFICDSCKNKLRLFTDETIKKYNYSNPAFKKEIKNRLKSLNKDYIKKRIKLLHVLDRLEEIGNK